MILLSIQLEQKNERVQPSPPVPTPSLSPPIGEGSSPPDKEDSEGGDSEDNGSEDEDTNEPEPAPTIESINDITETVSVNEAYTLPAQVAAEMSDKSTQKVDVTWNPSTVDTSEPGIYTFTGTVSGYSSNVTLTLAVEITISGQIILPESAPAGGISVNVYAVSIWDFEEGNAPSTSVMIPEGESVADYSLSVPEGQYVIKYHIPSTSMTYY